MSPSASHAAEGKVAREVAALWRIESAAIVAGLARRSGDLALAEDVAQDAVVAALDQWPRDGVPVNPGAWLTAVAQRRLVDRWRREARLQEHHEHLTRESEPQRARPDPQEKPTIDDDVLRLVFMACHPTLAPEARLCLTLKTVAGLSTDDIARLLLVPVPTVQQRIVRAKRTLTAAAVPFSTPEPDAWPERLSAVLGVIYLMFTEGYAASTGTAWMRPELAAEALRLGRRLATLVPREPEVHGLVALMEFQSSRFAARLARAGEPVLLADQDRSRWDRGQVARGLAALERVDDLGRGRGAYALQASIAACHASAASVESTDWERIVVLYEALGRVAPNPIVDLNRAVAISMTGRVDEALALVDSLAADQRLARSHLVPSVRGELLDRLGRTDDAVEALVHAASLARNERERSVLQAKAKRLTAQRPR